MLDWWLEILSDMMWCRRQWSAQGQKILNSLLLSLWVQQNWQSPPPNLPPHNFQRHSSFEDDQHNLTFDLLEKSPSSLLNKDHFRSFLSLLIYTLSISNAWHWTWTVPGGWLWRSTYRSLLKSKLCQITFLDTGIIRATTPYSRMC